MRRIIGFLLAFVLVFSGVSSFAAPGDIIHTGLKKLFKADDIDGILKSIDDGEDINKFYRENEDGTYTNITNEQKEQMDFLFEKLSEANIDLNDHEAISSYLDSIGGELDKKLKEITESNTYSFEKIADPNKGDKEDYYGPTPLPSLIIPDNFSMPEPGSADGTTMIKTLVYPSGSSQFLYKVLEGKEDGLKLNAVIEDGIRYKAEEDIGIEAGKYIGLYATDRSNKLKAYANVKVEESMIRRAATLLEGGSVGKGKDKAYAIGLTGLDLSNGNWNYFVRDTKLKDVFTNDKFRDAKKYEDDMEIVVADSSITIDESFKRYVYLIGLDGEKITSYYVFEVSKDNISLPPTELVAGDHYTGPEMGVGEYTTRFNDLVLENATWYVKVGKDLTIPVAGTLYSGASYNVGYDIEAVVGDRLLLLAVIDGKVSHYAMFELKEEHVKGKVPNTFVIEPKKGMLHSTTMVSGIDKPEGATKFMYAVGDGLGQPFLDRKFEGALDYTLGEDIEADEGQTLYILATDADGRVNMYGVATLSAGNIKDPLADSFKEIENYSMPERGLVDGTTKFRHLNYDGVELYYKVSIKENDPPEKNSNLPVGASKVTSIESIKILEPTDSKLKDEKGFTMYLMIYAVKDNKVVAFMEFTMDQNNVKLPEANKLPWKNFKPSETEDPLKPGTSANTTMLKVLNKDNIPGAKDLTYKYAFLSKSTTVGINEVVKGINTLNPETNLFQAYVGDYLLILLVDGANRTKYYASVPLTEDNTRIGNAVELKDGKHYSSPKPGTAFSSTRFDLLNLSDVNGATQFMVIKGNVAFKPVELNKKVNGAFKYATVDNDDKITYFANDGKTDLQGNILGVDAKDNKYLQLLATDDDGLVRGYANFQLAESQLRGKEAKPLTSINFTLGKGVKPGTVRFTSLSNFNIGNNAWKYEWANDRSKFDNNLPYEGQIINTATVINTKQIDQYTVESINDINVGDAPNHGHILLLATSNNRVLGYAIMDVKEEHVQNAASELKIGLAKGTNTDTTAIVGEDVAKANVYIVSTTPFVDKPGPMEDLPKSGVKSIPSTREVSARVGEYLRIFNVDTNNKILGYKDLTIESDHIKQGSAIMEVMTNDGVDSNVYTVLEGRVKASALNIKVTLTDGTWADVVNDKTIKDGFLNAFKAQGKEQAEWNKVMQNVKDGRFSITKDGNVLTIITTATEEYNISENQRITLTIPARAIQGAINPIDAKGSMVIKPTIDARISGTVINNIRQSDVNGGRGTIVVEILDGKWVDNIEALKNDLLDGFTGGTAWGDLKTLLKSDTKSVKLTDPQMVTITIPKNEVKINAPETIALTIPAGLVDGESSPIIAAPTFTLYPDILPITVEDGIGTVKLEAPNYVNPLGDNDIWEIKLAGTTFRDEFVPTKDIIASGIPTGFKLEYTRLENNKLIVKLVGKASKELDNGAIGLVIKGSAINEKNYSDSKTIALKYMKNEKINLDNLTYDIKDDGIYLVITDGSIDKAELQFSINSTNGTNGTWFDIPVENKISKILEPITIYVKETKQSGNSKVVAKLVSPSAPNVSIEKYDYSDEFKVTLNDTTNLEYHLGDSSVWKKVDGDIKLAKDSILRVRKEAVTGEEGVLPSLPTKQLNGVYLGQVSIKVAEGKISGTTANMEYSTNGEESYLQAKLNETPDVKFVSGVKVFIRERGNPINIRPLGTVGQEELAADDVSLIDFSIVGKEITSTGIELGKLQYRFENEHWKDVGNGENIEFKPGSLQFRKKGTDGSLPSIGVEKIVISSHASPPELRVDDFKKKIEYKVGNEWKDIKDKTLLLEFKIDSENAWKDGDKWNPESIRHENAKVHVRIKATTEALHSQSTTISFTKNLTFGDVRLNVGEGYIEGTTTNMQYSTTSSDGKNGTWIDCNNNRTKIDLTEGMKVYVREKGKIENAISSPFIVERMEKPDLTGVSYDIATRKITNSSDQNLQYRINIKGDESWKSASSQSDVYEVDFKAGILQFRNSGTFDKLPSFAVEKVTIKAKASAPSLAYDNTEHKISKIGTSDGIGYEYNIKGGPWIKGEIDTQFNGNDIVRVRFEAKWDRLASEEQEIIFTPNLNLYDVKLNVREGKIQNTTVDMEYSLDSADGISGTWTKCTSPSTTVNLKSGMTVYVREIKKPRNKREITEKPVVQRAFDSDVASSISFDIKDKIIWIKTGVDVNKQQEALGSLQYRNGSENWVNIEYLTLEKNKEKIVLVNNVNFVQGNLEFRLKGDEGTLPSEVVLKSTIMASVSAPNVSKGFDIDKYRNKVSYTGNMNDLEYSFNESGPWIDGSNLDSEILDRDVFIRTKASEKELSSSVKKLDFNPVLNLKVVNLSTHVSPLELNGTTKDMEYRVNDGIWQKCIDGNTKLKRNDGVTDLNVLGDVYKLELRDGRTGQQTNQITVYPK